MPRIASISHVHPTLRFYNSIIAIPSETSPMHSRHPIIYSRSRSCSQFIKAPIASAKLLPPKTALATVVINRRAVDPSLRREMGSNEIIPGTNTEVTLSSSYDCAMDALSSLISRQKRGGGDGMKHGEEKFNLKLKYLKILGLEEHLASLKIIHVAGTKGKGSTCTFTEAILRECGFKTGLFTSPHLIDVRERLRINGLDISEDKFLHYFWDCWHQLKEKVADGFPMPPLFHFLSLLAFKIFLSEKVDVAIIEVGLGGRFDSTNVVKSPVVCGVASLGMDHMEVLGDTIQQIASSKAGIFKPEVPAFTAPQLPEAMAVLEERASELMIPLRVAPPLDLNMLNGLKLGLAGEHQLINAGLAVALCKSWLQRTGHAELILNCDQETGLTETFRRGLSIASLLGRAQIVIDKTENYDKISGGSYGDLIFYLDGAHTPESMEVCAKWFCSTVTDVQQFMKNESIKEQQCESNMISKKILLFNCMEVRDPRVLLPQLVNTCSSRGVYFSKALFVPSMSTYNKVGSGSSVVTSEASGDLSWQFTIQETWEKLVNRKDAVCGNCYNLQNLDHLSSNGMSMEKPCESYDPAGKSLVGSVVMPSLPLAIKWLRDCGKENPSLQLQVLVTGSIHLVGDVLKLVRR